MSKKFKEQRLYSADEVDSEIAILTQGRDFWKKEAERLQKRLNQKERE